jgi:hypothetical protein
MNGTEVIYPHPTVLDLIVTFGIVFFASLLFSAVALVACRFRPWLLAIFLPFAAYWAYANFKEMYEPSIYDSVQADFGGHAVIANAIAGAIIVAAPLVGFALGRRRIRPHAA